MKLKNQRALSTRWFCRGCQRTEALAHDLDGFRAGIDEEKATTQFHGSGPCCAAAGEEVEYEIAGIGVNANDAFQELSRLLRGVACFLVRVSGNDGNEPDVGGNLVMALKPLEVLLEPGPAEDEPVSDRISDGARRSA